MCPTKEGKPYDSNLFSEPEVLGTYSGPECLNSTHSRPSGPESAHLAAAMSIYVLSVEKGYIEEVSRVSQASLCVQQKRGNHMIQTCFLNLKCWGPIRAPNASTALIHGLRAPKVHTWQQQCQTPQFPPEYTSAEKGYIEEVSCVYQTILGIQPSLSFKSREIVI